MADITFTPTFKHTPWIDNQDRVQAGGTNGFNVRLTAIQTDLEALSSVVSQVSAALAALGASPPLTTYQLTLSPALAPIMGVDAWALDSDGNARAIWEASASGVGLDVDGLQAVSVPNGATLVSLRVLGQNNSAKGYLSIGLYRAKLLAPPAPAELLAQVTGSTDPFDGTSAVDPGAVIVDTGTYHYFVRPTLYRASPGDTVLLSGFQITYQAT